MVNGDDFMPKECFFTKGVGRHKEKLMSFELALRDAGIEKQNLVRVSSSYPTSCTIISLSKMKSFSFSPRGSFNSTSRENAR